MKTGATPITSQEIREHVLRKSFPAILVASALLLTLVANPSSGQNVPLESPVPSVRYADFGAVGDGKADDFDAIVKAHHFANKHGRPVRADDDATYYIGGADQSAVIQTSTDFGKARFVIDDRELENIKRNVFEVRSTFKPIRPPRLRSLMKGQATLETELPSACVVVVTDRNIRRYIRRGLNPNNGSHQTDVFLVDKEGRVDPNTPIIWDFEQITNIVAYPVDEQTLTITGGRFTTIANQAESKYNYHARGIEIKRSNVLVESLIHEVTGEGESGAPYHGFISISDCANVTIRDTTLTGRKTYRTIGRAGKPVPMGSYDLSFSRALNVSLINCNQTNDINDRRFWGIMGTNFCKNILLDGCTLSRFDAHQGVTNATIRNSTLGYMGILAIGHGKLLIEETTVLSRQFLRFRPDYGSTWKGDLVIRNCVFRPNNGKGKVIPVLIGGSNDGQHDFGYTCSMPETITIDGLHIDDANAPDDYAGPVIFANFNQKFTREDYEEQYPYLKTKRVIVKGVTTVSGLPLGRSQNEVMFRDVEVQMAGDD